MSDERPKRQQTQTERDLDGLAARRERTRSPARGVPVDFDEITGNYEGEDLARMRALRPTPARLYLLEKKQDEDRDEHKALVEKVDGLAVTVASIDGKLSVLPDLLTLLKGKQDAAVAVAKDNNETARLGISTRGKIIMAAIGLVSTALGALVASMAGCA